MPRRIIVHSLDQARAALSAAAERGVPVLLQSPPGAAGYLGPAGFLALVRLAGADEAVVDCGNAPGHALAALRAGARRVAVAADAAVMVKLADIAGQCGATLEPPQPALDLGTLPERDWPAACRDWLSA